MKNILIAIIMALPFIALPATAGLPWNDVVTGTCGDSEPGFDLEPALGAGILAALAPGSDVLWAAGGAWLGDELDQEAEGDAIDAGTMIGAAIGTVVAGPVGAFVGAALGDWTTDHVVCN